MSRLSLDAFKAKADKNEQQELENLTGGILGDCHPSWLKEDIGEIIDSISSKK